VIHVSRAAHRRCNGDGVASVAILPALALVGGVLAGLAAPWDAWTYLVPLVAVCGLAAVSWTRGRTRVTTGALVLGFAACGAANASHARERALHTPLRTLLDSEFGAFALASLGPGGAHAPILARARIADDAALRDGFASVRVDVLALRIRDDWRDVSGGALLSVSGMAAVDKVSAWRAGRIIEAPVTFRRPARYLNDGVPDFERDLALDGTTLLGTVKSALLVELIARGAWHEEVAAEARAHVRRIVAQWVGARSATSAALVTAVLIGDRAAIADDVRERLQVSGTYHVIAISGGNIAVFVVIVSVLCRLTGLGPRAAALVTLAVLLAYAAIVVSGPSVRRAVVVAALYLGARAVDHRAPPWHAAALACAGLLVAWPLDLRDVGFALTFGAASALLAASSLMRSQIDRRPVRWLVQSMGASLAVEAVLLPVQALAFGRVSLAGIVLNLVAVPAMTVAQLAGLALIAAESIGAGAAFAGWVAHSGVQMLLGAASLAEASPWAGGRAPPPSWIVVAVYYGALAAVVRGPRRALAAAAAVVCLAAAAAIVSGVAAIQPPGSRSDRLRLTVLDVGQAEAILLEPPGGPPVLVDTGGSPFGGGLDVGTRVVAPALWARGVTSLSSLLITHGDPDHMGGAAGVLTSLRVGEAWFGIRVPHHAAGTALLADLAARRIGVRYLRAGAVIERGGVSIRVLHPPEPDWERPRVRNDDSVVLEVRYRDVAMLLAGDVSASVERTIAPQLTPARIRILKVAHHGSRTSTSRELVERWRPQLALISAGRGNAFGHPTRDVLERLGAAGARVLRTDRDGQITVETDGHSATWRVFAAL
jgi:competence protein ComEC